MGGLCGIKLGGGHRGWPWTGWGVIVAWQQRERWADLAPLFWAAIVEGSGLSPEAGIKAGDFAVDSTLLGVEWEGGLWEEHDFLFQYFGSRNICGFRY